MRALPVFDPFVDFDRLFEGLMAAKPRSVTGGNPLPLDVFEKDGSWVVRASLPGIKAEDIDVSLEEGMLTLRGELTFEEEHKDAKVYRREIATGSFVRSIRLPKDIDAARVSATFENGLVTITIPRVIEDKPAAIKVPVKAIESSPSTDVTNN